MESGNRSNSNDWASIATKWWYQLQTPLSSNRGALATLRRAQNEIEVLQVSQALKLVSCIGTHVLRVTTLAGILAHVRTSNDLPLIRALGRKNIDAEDSARLSEQRFRRVLQSQDTELMDAVRRLIHLNDQKAHVYELSRSILSWNDKVKKNWIYQYYGIVSNQAPGSANSTISRTPIKEQ